MFLVKNPIVLVLGEGVIPELYSSNVGNLLENWIVQLDRYSWSTYFIFLAAAESLPRNLFMNFFQRLVQVIHKIVALCDPQHYRILGKYHRCQFFDRQTHGTGVFFSGRQSVDLINNPLFRSAGIFSMA